jgi:hypothetical protein
VLEGSFKKLSVAIAAAFAIGKIKSFIASSVELADIQLQAEAKLRQALQGREDMFQRLTARASELQKVTVIGDEAIIAQQSFLAAQGRTEEQINNTIDAAIQLAAVTDTDLATAVQTLDKTLEGNAGRLGNLDERFKGLTAEQLKSGAAIDLINEKYKGFAETAATTGTGALKQLGNTFGDIQEEVGKRVIPVLNGAAKAINFVIDNAQTLGSVLKVGATFIGIYAIATKGLSVAKAAYTAATKVATGATRMFNMVLKANPIGLIVGLLIAAGVAIYEFREQINAGIAKLREFVKPLDMVLNGLEKIGITIGRVSKEAGEGVDQLGKLRKALEGLTDAEKIARLEKWRKTLEGNADAVRVIDAQIDKLKLNMVAAQKSNQEQTEDYKKQLEARLKAEQEYQKKREQIGREIEDLHISLIADEQQREDMARQTKFMRMIQDLEREQDITAAEKDALRSLILQKQEEENKAVAEARAKAAEEASKKEKEELIKADLERSKLRLELFEKHFQPTIEAMQERELDELEKALESQLIAYEEYEMLRAEIQGKYAKIREDEEKRVAQETLAAMTSAASAFSSAFGDIISAIGDESSDLADFTKALAIFDVAMKQGQAIAAAIAGATAAAAATGAGAPFVLAGYIASMIGSVVAGFAQVGSLLAAEPPRYFEGTASVELGGNKPGRDTVPALLNQGEAVIPTDDNRAYPGLAEAWIGGDLDRYIHKNWVAPQLREKERERAERELNAIGQMMAQGFDDYRLHKDNREMIGVMRSGFATLRESRKKVRGRS